MKILITGGAGYLGTELAAALARRDEVSEIILYDNLSRGNVGLFLGERLPRKPVRFVQGDILDRRTLATHMDGVDTLYHLAAKVTTPFAEADLHTLEQVNHWGTAELSYLLEQTPVKRVIYLSSSAVYGPTGGPRSAASSPAPTTAYGISKYRGERMLERLAEALDLHIVRCANVYGYSKSMRFDSVVNRFLWQAHFLRRLTAHGSGEQLRAFIYIENAIRTLVAFALGVFESGTFDLVERNLSVLEVIDTVRQLHPGVETLFLQQDVPMRSLEVTPDPKIVASGLFDGRDFATQLTEFDGHFAF